MDSSSRTDPGFRVASKMLSTSSLSDLCSGITVLYGATEPAEIPREVHESIGLGKI